MSGKRALLSISRFRSNSRDTCQAKTSAMRGNVLLDKNWYQRLKLVTTIKIGSKLHRVSHDTSNLLIEEEILFTLVKAI